MSQLRHCAGHLLSIVYSLDTRTHRHHSPQYIDDVLVVVELLQGQVMVVGDPDFAQSFLKLTHLVGRGHLEDRPAVLVHLLAVGEEDVALVYRLSLPLMLEPALVHY